MSCARSMNFNRRHVAWKCPPEVVVCGNYERGKEALLSKLIRFPVPLNLPFTCRICIRNEIEKDENNVMCTYEDKDADVIEVSSYSSPSNGALAVLLDADGVVLCHHNIIPESASSIYTEILKMACIHADSSNISVVTLRLKLYLLSPRNMYIDVTMMPHASSITPWADGKQADLLLRDHVFYAKQNSFYIAFANGFEKLQCEQFFRYKPEVSFEIAC